MAKDKKKLPKTAIGRATKLFSMGSSIVTREIADRVKSVVVKHGDERLQTRLKQAEDMVETLGQLKGAAMKAGQLLSMEISDLLPPEVSEVLRKLHDRAPPADFAIIQQVLREDLGDKIDRLENLSQEPIASASIGQVHSATVDGQKVAVKIQYPGVAGSIDSDLNILRKFLETATNIYGKKFSLGPLFEELRESLQNEVNYLKEAEYLSLYRETFSSDHYVVPAVYNELTAQRVLTMSFEEGTRINDWLKRDLNQEHRNKFGHLVLKLILDEFFIHGIVQTDPNYGNFLYRQGPGQLVLLDFGAVKQYDPKFRRDIRELLVLGFNNDREGLIQCLIDYKLIDERESPELKDLLIDMITQIMATFRPEHQPFSYDDPNFLSDIRNRTTILIRDIKYSPPAKTLIFLNRKLGGMYHLLREAQCRIDLHKYWQEVMESDI